MKIPLEECIPYRLLALSVLAVFYGIYLVKQWRQKGCGIRTIQIECGKDAQTHTVETLMGIATPGYEYLDVLQTACGINHCDAPAADSVCKAPLIYAKKTRETRTGNYKTN